MSGQEDGTQERIIAAAGEIFADVGYDRATVREICNRANVNVASINYHFGDKQKLYRETLNFAFNFVLETIPLHTLSSDLPANERLLRHIHVMLQRMLSKNPHQWQSRLLMREYTQTSAFCKDLIQSFIRPQHDVMVALIREMVGAEIPNWKVQQLVFSIVGQGLYYRFGQTIMDCVLSEQELQEHFSEAELANHIYQVMMSTLTQYKTQNLSSQS